MRSAIAVLLLAVMAAGCSDAVPEELPKPVNPRTITMRLLGVRAPGPVLVQVDSVDAVVDGRAISVALQPGQVDLGRAEHAWPVATFELPEGAQRVAFNLEFAAEGSLERTGVPEPLDLRGAPISWVSSSALLLERNKVVVEVDVSRSLAERAAQPPFFMPSFILRY